ncbi:BTB/POZ domain-containing protein KCTD1-like [Glandiceps talaboti]
MAYQIKTTVGEMVSLNVGGKLYTTSLTTLTRFPDSMLGTMFSGNVPVQTDDKGNYLIDRDGELFRHVLNFLRITRLQLPRDFEEHDSLIEEADFYQLNALKDAVAISRDKKNNFEYVIFSEKLGGRSICKIVATRHVIEALPSLVEHAQNDSRWLSFQQGHTNSETYGVSFSKSIQFHVQCKRTPNPPSVFNILELFHDLETLGFILVSSSCGCREQQDLNVWTFRRSARSRGESD